jgi:hypothetical protein
MKDAAVFTRKIQIGTAPVDESVVGGGLARDIEALAGTVGGYQIGKATRLTTDAVNAIFKDKGLTEQQLMSVLLSSEGKKFLQNAAISPQSKNTLQSLADLDKASPILPFAAATTALPTTQTQAPTQQPTIEMPIDVELPPDLMGGASKMDIELPSDLTKPPLISMPTTEVERQKYRQNTFNQELQNLTALQMKQQSANDIDGVNRTTRDIDALMREAQRSNVSLSQ